MTAGAKVESFAVRQRRASRREEWTEQTKLAQLLPKYLNPKCTFWSHSRRGDLRSCCRMIQ
jgi:hypothetical protein